MYPPSFIYAMQHQHHFCILSQGPRLPTKSIDSFTLFPLLPPELRLRIWEIITLEDRQNMELSCTSTTTDYPHGRWFSHSPNPILLSICAESRAFALQKYSILTFSRDQSGIRYPKTFYINFTSEALWLCGDLHEKRARDLLSKNQHLQESLQYLVMSKKLWKLLTEREPGPSLDGGYVWPNERSVIDVLKGLVEVKYHS